MSDYSDDPVVIDRDEISNYNPDQILPESPEEIRKIRAWLNPTDYALDSGEYHKHLTSHLPGTGTWLTSNVIYRNWLQNDNDGLLWLKGIPGSGKSVLAAHLVDHLASSHPGPVLYFFFRQIIDANHEPAALLRDWLDQILIYSPPLQKRLKELIKMRRSVDSIAMEDQWSHLKLAINGLADKVFCVADALDEMDQGNDEFLRSLTALGQWKPEKAKVLITSRPVPTVEMPLRNSNPLIIRLVEKDVDIDIATYVDHGLKVSNIATSDQALIKEEIPGRANGLFLYAKLALDAFLEPEANIGNILQALPADLHDMYTRLLREHGRRSGVPDHVQLHILQWVTHATRPLRLLELAEMLNATYHSDESDLKAKKDLVRAATGPLLEILPDETVCVIHHSFTEYLKCITRREDDGGYPVLQLGATHAQLANACLSYLQSGCLDSVKVTQDSDSQEDRHGINGPEEQQRMRLRYPFYSYAAANWHIHVARSASDSFPQADLNNAIENFLKNEQWRKAWLKLHWSQGGRQVDGPTPLHIAAKYGLQDYVQYLIEAGGNVDACDASGKTPLWFAASSGHADIVRRLVTAGADPDVDDKINGLKPLHEAASVNHAEAVKALLEAGVDPLTKKTREHPGNWCGNAPRSTGHTPLMYACKNGHLEALEAFIPFLADLDVVHRALQWTALAGRSRLVRRILHYPGVQVNAKVRGDTALVAACRSYNRDTIITLIEAGADPSILCEDLGPEFGGIGSGRLVYFIDDSDQSDDGERPKDHRKDGFTVLHALCNRRYASEKLSVEELHELVTLLIGKGADIHQQDFHGNTALHLAVDDPVLLRLLLDAGSDANAVNHSGQAPLHLVTSPDSISLLIEFGADLNKIDPHRGQSPILILLGSYHTEATLKLLEYGPDLTIKDKEGSGPLHIGLKQYDVDTTILKQLLAAGADPNESNRLGETPLLGMHLDQRSAQVALDTLLNAGADINATDSTGLTVLSRAMVNEPPFGSRDHKDVEALLDRGAKIDVRDFDGRSLLHLAVSSHSGYSSYSRDRSFRLDYLLTKGLDITTVDYDGNTLMHELAMKRDVLDSYHGPKYIPLAKQLFRLGVNPDQRNHQGRTALHLLATRLPFGTHTPSYKPGIDTVFDMILSQSKNIDMPDNQGLTALHLASTVSEWSVKKLLEAGADPTVTSSEGLAPLHLAARSRHSNIVGQLLEAIKTSKKKSIELEDESGHTALYYACMSGRPETVRLLLDTGAVSSAQHLFAACAAFETEDALWVNNSPISASGRSRKTPIVAAGLTLKDQTRPISAFHVSSQSVPLHPYSRLDEVLDVLVAHGVDIHGMENSSIPGAATKGHWYTVDCFVQAKERHPRESTSKPQSTSQPHRKRKAYYPWISSNGTVTKTFAEHAGKIYREAQLKAVSEFTGIRENASNSDLVEYLLKQRQFHTMEALFHSGVNFLVDADEHGNQSISNMQTFVRAGLASLVGRLGELEAVRQFENGQWHAFGDSSKPGLYKKANLESMEAGSSPNFLLYDAIHSPSPNMEVVRLLVEKFQVDVNEMKYKSSYDHEKKGYHYEPEETALHYLAKGEHWWHVSLALPYLISKGANVNIRNANNHTPLHIALGAGHFYVGTFHEEAARALTIAGADLNALDDKGMSCLAYACSSGRLVKTLIDNGATVDIPALFAAVEHKQIAALEILLSAGANPNVRRPPRPESVNHWSVLSSEEQYPLWVAATSHGVYRTAVTNEEKETRDACLKMVNILLAHGADPFATFEGQNSHYRSHHDDKVQDSEDNDISLVRTEEMEVDSEFLTVTILHDLLEHNNLVHPILCMEGLDPQRRDSRGRTVLHAACLGRFGLHAPMDVLLTTTDPEYTSPEVEHASFLSHLTSRGADIFATDNQGRNILHLILSDPTADHAPLSHPILSVLPFLSKKHVSGLVNEADVYGNTPLHLGLRYAVLRNDASPAEALLKLGADPFAKDNKGHNALHILAYGISQSEAARALFSEMLSLGLDINCRDNLGQTPAFNLNKSLHCRYEYRRSGFASPSEALALFEDAGADLFAKDVQERGLLHVAARSRATATGFELLLQKGLDALMEDKNRRTALDVADACDNQIVLKLFDKDNVRNKVSVEDIILKAEYDSDDMGF